MNNFNKKDYLVDNYGRTIKSLRLSITDRCNLNCIYCHNEGSTGSNNELSVQTISNIIHVAVKFGINRLKISGGEPLLRKDLEEILKSLPPLQDISLTTNGVFLKERASSLKKAGLNRVNISLDSLNENSYNFITKCNNGTIYKVISGIKEAVNVGLTPIKLNMVLLKGINESQIEDMLNLTRRFNGKVILQLIQLMNFKEASVYSTDMDKIEHELDIKAGLIEFRELHHRKKYLINGAEVEFVRPVDNTEFCANCNRLRITADGKIRPCLLVNNNLVDISHASMDEMYNLFKIAVNKRAPFYSHIKEKE